MSKKKAPSKLQGSFRFEVACRSAEVRALREGRRRPGMFDLFHELLHDGQDDIVAVFVKAGVKVDQLDFNVEVNHDKDERQYGSVLRHAEEIAYAHRSDEVRLEYLVVATMALVAQAGQESAAGLVLSRQHASLACLYRGILAVMKY